MTTRFEIQLFLQDIAVLSLQHLSRESFLRVCTNIPFISFVLENDLSLFCIATLFNTFTFLSFCWEWKQVPKLEANPYPCEQI